MGRDFVWIWSRNLLMDCRRWPEWRSRPYPLVPSIRISAKPMAANFLSLVDGQYPRCSKRWIVVSTRWFPKVRWSRLTVKFFVPTPLATVNTPSIFSGTCCRFYRLPTRIWRHRLLSSNVYSSGNVSFAPQRCDTVIFSTLIRNGLPMS